MAIGMPVWLMHSDIALLVLSFSVSKSTMETGRDEHAVLVELVHAVGDQALGVLFFCVWISVASSGVSIPVNRAKKFASRIIPSSSSSSARFSEASVEAGR